MDRGRVVRRASDCLRACELRLCARNITGNNVLRARIARLDATTALGGGSLVRRGAAIERRMRGVSGIFAAFAYCDFTKPPRMGADRRDACAIGSGRLARDDRDGETGRIGRGRAGRNRKGRLFSSAGWSYFAVFKAAGCPMGVHRRSADPAADRLGRVARMGGGDRARCVRVAMV